MNKGVKRIANTVNLLFMLLKVGLGTNGIVGRLTGSPQVITSSQTYVPTTGTKFVIVEQQAPGGNGANAPATASGYSAPGGGGGSGAYARFMVYIDVISDFTVTIGSVASHSNSSVQSGSSSFCGVTCSGGVGPAIPTGLGNSTTVQNAGGTGGSVTDAETTTLTMIESYKGNNGGDALNTSAGNALSGLGAPSKLYGSSRRVGGSAAGNDGVRGAGGSGANSQSYTTSGLTGGAGGEAVTIIWEFA